MSALIYKHFVVVFVERSVVSTTTASDSLLPLWVGGDPSEQKCVAASAPSLALHLVQPDTQTHTLYLNKSYTHTML